MKKSFYLLSGLALLAASPVVAGINPANWTGVYGGVGVNWSSMKTQETIYGTKPKVSGFGYGLELGGGAAVLPNLYLGANLSFDLSTASKKYAAAGGLLNVKIKQKSSYAGTVQVGVPLCNFMPYAEFGYGQGSSRITATENVGGTTLVSLKPKNKGPIFGLGLKYQPTKNVLLGIAYRYQPAKLKIKDLEGSVKTRGNSIRLSASYLFNF